VDSEPLFAWYIKKFRNFEAIFTSGAMKIRAHYYDIITIQGVFEVFVLMERWSNVEPNPIAGVSAKYSVCVWRGGRMTRRRAAAEGRR
jgi:hypothetical protein